MRHRWPRSLWQCVTEPGLEPRKSGSILITALAFLSGEAILAPGWLSNGTLCLVWGAVFRTCAGSGSKHIFPLLSEEAKHRQVTDYFFQSNPLCLTTGEKFLSGPSTHFIFNWIPGLSLENWRRGLDLPCFLVATIFTITALLHYVLSNTSYGPNAAIRCIYWWRHSTEMLPTASKVGTGATMHICACWLLHNWRRHHPHGWDHRYSYFLQQIFSTWQMKSLVPTQHLCYHSFLIDGDNVLRKGCPFLHFLRRHCVG